MHDLRLMNFLKAYAYLRKGAHYELSVKLFLDHFLLIYTLCKVVTRAIFHNNCVICVISEGGCDPH